MEILPIVIYVLLIILIVVAIIGGIKLIITLDKVDDLIGDVNRKVKSLDKLFEVVDFATNRMSMVSEVVISFITGGLKKFFNSTSKEQKTKKTKKEEDINE